MQGKKLYQEKLFSNFQLSKRVPPNNFYRSLSNALDLSFVYKLTKPYYGRCGQKSIDPDARISVKPGKARKLNYLSQLSVDTAHHVITHIQADLADKKDSQCLQDITLKLRERLKKQGLLWHNLAADAGYSSGENYAFLEKLGLQSYIPPHGTYKGGPEGFKYVEEGDYWLCPNNKKVTFRKVTVEKNRNNNKKKLYLTRASDCKGCPYKTGCAGKAPEKRITITIYKEEYERAIARVKSNKGRYMKSKRQSTVEPVFGTLTQFMGMRKINTIGISQANKIMLMAAMSYNLKKYLKFTQTKAVSAVNNIEKALTFILGIILSILVPYKQTTKLVPTS